MIEFIKTKFIDVVLCLGMSLGLIYPIFSGFVLNDIISNNLIVAGCISLFVLLICLLFSYNKRTVISGFVIAIAVIVLISIYLAKNAVLAHESDNSLTVSLIIVMFTSFLVYIANSKKLSLIILFLIGNIILAGAYFLQFPVEIIAIFTFDFSILVAFWYKTYKVSLYLAQAGQVQSKRYMIQNVCLVVLVILLCSGIYYGFIQAIDPPTRELKLIEKLENMEILKQLGIFSQYDQFDPNMLSNNVPQDQVDGNISGEENNNDDGQKEDIENNQDAKNKDNGFTKQLVQKIKYNLYYFVVPWSAIIIGLFIVLFILLHYLLKKIWEKKIESLSLENQIVNYYLFFLRRLNKTNLKRLKTDTLKEYSQKMDYELSEFDTSIKFSTLTNIYMDVYYGQTKVDQQQVQLFKQYYQCFYKGLKKEIGFIKYYLNRLIFRI